ncbi:MAG: amidase [Alcanivoracaceae bacterium]
MSNTRIHAFTDDALADHDAVALAEMVRRREVSAAELTDAAISRAERVNDRLNAIQVADFDRARARASQGRTGIFVGVPTFIKDNTDVAGLPTRHGSLAVPATPAQHDGAFARQYLAQGFNLLGKTTLPEFGFNGTTEYQSLAPTRNPWHTDYSSGGSSGGSAALVAAGVVPIAHANDGGGSIRIPAACCGLVGLKSTRGRFVTNEMAKTLPVNVVCDGVVTRSVRDTAHFFAGAEQYWRNRKLPEVGLVEGPGRKRLKIGLVMDSLTGPTCAETRATVEDTVALLESLGHRVEIMPLPVRPSFVDDFSDYWGFLAFMAGRFGKHSFGKEFDAAQLDALSQGLAERFRKRGWRLPAVLFRLQRSWHDYAKVMREYDAVLSPVLAHTTPELGYISPEVPFEELFERMMNYVSFTPMNNASGSPAISLPIGESQQGLPIAVQFSAAHGAERTLLELAFEIEQATPWRRITA